MKKGSLKAILFYFDNIRSWIKSDMFYKFSVLIDLFLSKFLK